MRAQEKHYQSTGDDLEAWIERADAAGIKHGRRFALGLKGDQAVRAGLTEGQVGRLKVIKRQGYGRAGVPLLRARVLSANTASALKK